MDFFDKVNKKRDKIFSIKETIMKDIEGLQIDLKISKGNRKCKIPYYSHTPITTCGSKRTCNGVCYAAKAFLMYPNVKTRMIKNEKVARTNKFAGEMIAELKRNFKKGMPKQFRIHESGDFISQVYLKQWYSIMRQFPETTFYAYTTRLNLDFKKNKPKNFVLNFSSSGTFLEKRMLKKKGFDNITRIIKTPGWSKSGEMICRGGVNEKVKCGENCNICYTSGSKMKVINFIEH